MSDIDWPDDEEVIEMPDLDTEEHRDLWVEQLASVSHDDTDGWCKAIIVDNGERMVLRAQYQDGNEEMFDLIIDRKMQIVRKEPDGVGSN